MDLIDTSKPVELKWDTINELITNFNTTLKARGLSNDLSVPAKYSEVKSSTFTAIRNKKSTIKSSSATYGTCSTVRSFSWMSTSTPDVTQGTCIEASDINELITDVNKLLSQCSCNTYSQTSKSGGTICDHCAHCSNSVCDCEVHTEKRTCSNYESTSKVCESVCTCDKVCTECDLDCTVNRDPCDAESESCSCDEETTCRCNLYHNACVCESDKSCKVDGCSCNPTCDCNVNVCDIHTETSKRETAYVCDCQSVLVSPVDTLVPTTKCECDGNDCSCNDDCSCNQVCNCNWV